MIIHKKKCPTVAGSSISETIHLEPVNNPYFSMILNNRECALFCFELLETFDDLIGKFCPDNPQAFKINELSVFVSLYNLRLSIARESQV